MALAALLYVPAPHATHAVAPPDAPYVPAVQMVHTLLLLATAYEPPLHTVQAVAEPSP